jgi:hypothetical protein
MNLREDINRIKEVMGIYESIDPPINEYLDDEKKLDNTIYDKIKVKKVISMVLVFLRKKILTKIQLIYMP